MTSRSVEAASRTGVAATIASTTSSEAIQSRSTVASSSLAENMTRGGTRTKGVARSARSWQ